MIRLIQRRLIVPRGDTGTFSIPMLPGKDNEDMSIFTIFDPLTHRKIFEKVMNLSDGVLTMDLTHGDTVNLPVGQYVWDIKFYDNPVIVNEQLVSGEEVDSYYAAFQLPTCEIRETGDDLLMADDAPTSKLEPGQIQIIENAIVDVHSSRDAAANSAAEASMSATSAETSASAASVAAQAAQDSQAAALASQQAAQAAAVDLANSVAAAAASATAASASETAALAAQNAAESASAAANSSMAQATTQANSALASASAAANSATSASNASQAAASSAALALASEQAAGTSETNAAASATAAASSATAAATSAQQAQQTAQAIHEEIPTRVSQLQNDSGYITGYTETDPTVPSWAKAAQKPSYTAQEVGALPANTFIPTRVSDLMDDSGHYTKPANGIPAADLEESYVKPADYATNTTAGVIKVVNADVSAALTNQEGGSFLYDGKLYYLGAPDENQYKAAVNHVSLVSVATEHLATFYGLAKAAGDTTQINSNHPVGTYTSTAKIAIQTMLDVPSNAAVTSAISTAIGNINSFDMAVVQALPSQDISTHTIYLVPKTGETNDVYDEYVYINNAWEMVGNTQIDLSNYATKSEIPSVPVQDVQVNGNSILSNGTANIPYADDNTYGLVKTWPNGGITVSTSPNEGRLVLNPATDPQIKAGNILYKPIVPITQHEAAFYGLAKAAGDTTQSQSDNAVGTYTSEASAAIRTMLGAAASSDIPSVPVQDVQINGSSIINNGIANIPVGNSENFGVYKISGSTRGIGANSSGILYNVLASDSQIKGGAEQYRPIVPYNQHTSVFYGLAAAAGDTTQSQSNNAVGTYTTEAAAAIRSMLGVAASGDIPSVPVQDVQVNGTSILSNGTANVPMASSSTYGVTKVNGLFGLTVIPSGANTGQLSIVSANVPQIKAGSGDYNPITAQKNHIAVFYGLANAAGDTTQSQSDNAVGTYTSGAKTAIQTMLGITDALATKLDAADAGLRVVRLI